VLDLPGLRIEAWPRPSYFDRWFRCHITATARPFGGVLETIFTEEDFREFADALDQLDPDGEAMLGGNRAAELRLVLARQHNGPEGALAVECTLTPSGDDPYPLLRWLMFGIQPFATRTSAHLRTFAALHPWPTP
jgi:hypothetical protein